MAEFDKRKIRKRRKILTVFGKIAAIAGFALTVVGVAEYFISLLWLKTEAKLLFLLFIGIPLYAIGMALLAVAFRGVITMHGVGGFSYIPPEEAMEIASLTKIRRSKYRLVCGNCATKNEFSAVYCKGCGRKFE